MICVDVVKCVVLKYLALQSTVTLKPELDFFASFCCLHAASEDNYSFSVYRYREFSGIFCLADGRGIFWFQNENSRGSLDWQCLIKRFNYLFIIIKRRIHAVMESSRTCPWLRSSILKDKSLALARSGVHTAHDIGRHNDTGRCRPMSSGNFYMQIAVPCGCRTYDIVRYVNSAP